MIKKSIVFQQERMENKRFYTGEGGSTSYEWVVAYMGTVNSGSVAVPLDAALPEEARRE